MKYGVLISMLLAVWGARAQMLSGTVHDEISNAPLAGATVILEDRDKGGITDEQGNYLLKDLEPGRYTVTVSYVGYESRQITDVWVKAGKVTRQDFSLNPGSQNLDEVTVISPQSILVPGQVILTEEQVNRFAATYYDPARLATSSPDVAVTNDQNNQVAVRGLSPNYNTWRLEGAEIVNPNHLSNAGTFTDQPGLTGGGVNMLSAQMLSRSGFLFSTFDNSYANSTGGIFDMYMKNGNSQQKQYTAQASLIGFDLATDGPFKEGGKMTYSANYRYSFTGLLSNFGVDFGGESIGFQDLSFNVASPVGKRSEISLFGVGGLSSNEFTHKKYANSDSYKDRKDIDYHNHTGIIGIHLKNGFANSSLNTTLAVSGYSNSRKENRYDEEDEVVDKSEVDQSKALTSLHSQYDGKWGATEYNLGVLANLYDWQLMNTNNVSTYTRVQVLAAPYVQFHRYFGQSWEGTLGMTYNVSEGDQKADPRLSVSYQASTRHRFTLGMGLYSELLNPYNYAFVNEYQYTYWQTAAYGFVQSSRITLDYLYTKDDFSFNAEAFNYYFPEVYSGSYTSDAGTYGVTVTAEKSFHGNDYFRIGASTFNSTMAGYQHPYSTYYNVSAAYGREWHFDGGDKKRTLGVNVRVIAQGRQPYSSIAYIGSDQAIPIYHTPYYTTTYNRVDVRLQWVTVGAHVTTSWALDLQNAAGIRNTAYKYYDAFTGKEATQYQQGLIPILAYRVEW